MGGIPVQDKSESTSGLPDADAEAGALARAVARLGALTPRKAEASPAQGSEQSGLSVKLAAIEMTPKQRRRRFAFKVAAVVSLLLHAGSLVAFVAWHGSETGAVEQPSEAISVEIVASSTLEALTVKQVPEPAPSSEATAPTEGREEASEKTVLKTEPPPDPHLELQATKTPPAPVELPEALEDTSRQAKQDAPEEAKTPPPPPVEAPAVVLPIPRKAEVAEQEAAKRREPEKQEKKARERAPEGGVTSKAKAGKGTGGERASASSGSIMNYAAQVRARVAANKPAGDGLSGAVTVAFSVTTAGGLAHASVSRSSGNAALDQAALGSVRRSAPFPVPPADATPRQRLFEIQVTFSVQ